MSGLEVRPVNRRAELRAFIELPWDIYRNDPNWVPPIKSSLAALLNPRKHPFWKFSERELFLAIRGSEPVGRIAAIVDGNYNQYHGERMGAWGFFECARDPEAAAALFRAAEDWARLKKMSFLRGPLNPSTNYEVGLLVQGFDSPPCLMMPYNPGYYLELVHFCGFRKEKDLLAYRFTSEYEPPGWVRDMAQRLSQKGDMIIRHMDPKRFGSEVRLMNRIYMECWADNWGFVPMSDDELEVSAREMAYIFDPDLGFFLYDGEEAIGVCLILPDINPLLKRFNGTGGLLALLRKYLHWSEVSGMRGLMLGVKPAFRQMGAPFVMFDHLMQVLRAKEQFRYIELGWNLEDNDAINLLYEEGGGKPYKRYRIYRKDL
jgi:hypothetical protein